MDFQIEDRYSAFFWGQGATMEEGHYDVVLLTQNDYLNPESPTQYIQNVLKEDNLLTQALIKNGLKVTRINWDTKEFDWSKTRYVLFRATWDYFHRINEFKPWLEHVSSHTQLINSYNLIQWNL